MSSSWSPWRASGDNSQRDGNLRASGPRVVGPTGDFCLVLETSLEAALFPFGVVGVIREDDAAIVVQEDAAAVPRRYLGPMRPVRRGRARVRALSVGQADLLLAVAIALVNAVELLTGDVH